MGRGKHIMATQRLEILRLRNEKLTLRAISERLNISINAVHQALKHIKVNKSVSNKVRSERPRKTTPRFDRTIHRLSEADRFRTAVDIRREISTAMGAQISVHTVRRRLIEFGLRGRVARKKPFISKRNQKARVAFAKEHLLWTRQQWAKVIFTDESKFNCFGSDGRCYVRRRVGEEFDPKCLKSTIKGRGGSVMVWAGMTINGPGPICRINGIMDQHLYVDILDRHLIPFTQENMPEHWIFQADNDPKYTSRKAKRFLEEHDVNVMCWPSQSPDLNPIEHLWNDVDKEIKMKKPSNVNNLYKIVEDAWNNISIDRCIRLIDSMPRRCAEVLKKKGGPTKY